MVLEELDILMSEISRRVDTEPERSVRSEIEEDTEGTTIGSVQCQEGAAKTGESEAQYVYAPPKTQLDFNFNPAKRPEASPVFTGKHVRVRTTGTIKGRQGNVISGPQDIASLRKTAQETLYSVTVDKDGVILEIHMWGDGDVLK